MQWVDVAKAFSILIVVLAHTRIELAFLDVHAEWADFIVTFSATMRMPLFFAASGLFATRWITQRSWRELLTGKVALLTWVFLVWQPVVLAYKLLETAILPNQPDNSVASQIAKAVASPLRPNGELWFLWALALFFVTAKSMSRLPIWVQLTTAGVISIAWMAIGDTVLPDSVTRILGDGWTGAPRYFFFFLAAALLSSRIRAQYDRMHAVTAFALFAAWAAIVFIFEVTDAPLAPVRFFVSCLAVLGGFGLARVIQSARPLAFLGANTLQVYVAHVAIIVALVCVIHVGGLTSLARDWAGVTAAVVFATSLATSLALHGAISPTRVGRYMYDRPDWFTLNSGVSPKMRRRRR